MDPQAFARAEARAGDGLPAARLEQRCSAGPAPTARCRPLRGLAMALLALVPGEGFPRPNPVAASWAGELPWHA